MEPEGLQSATTVVVGVVIGVVVTVFDKYRNGKVRNCAYTPDRSTVLESRWAFILVYKQVQ